MTDRKFFSGLTDGMMSRRHSRIPDRQQTHFFWPNETDSEPFDPLRSRLRNRSDSVASLLSHSQASSDAEESRRRRLRNNESKIEFYDMLDVGTDTESVYSRASPRKQNQLKSKIEFYDYVDTGKENPDDDVQSVIERPMKKNPEVENGTNEAPVTPPTQNSVSENLAQNMQSLNLTSNNGYAPSPHENSRKKPQQYVDSFSESDDDDRVYRNRSHMAEERNYLPPRYPPSQRSVRSHPRRLNSEFFDFDDDGYDRQYDQPRRLKYRKPESISRMPRRPEFSPELSDDEFYVPIDGYRRRENSRSRVQQPERYRSNGRMDDTESYYRGRNSRRPPVNGFGSERDFKPPQPQVTPSKASPEPIQGNGYGNEMEPKMPAAARPPVKPLSRTMSVNEAKQRYHVNLKSNIFHTNPDYNIMVDQRKPLTIRDFAARQRVGVGLPDI